MEQAQLQYCQIGVYPQQIKKQIGQFVFDSSFDSGNLMNVEQVGDDHFNLWITPDCFGTSVQTNYRTWFYFSVEGSSYLQNIKFTIKNMSFQTKLFKNGMKPVYRAESQSLWQRIKDPNIADSVVQLETGIEITFNHEFNGEKTYFAFCHPYSYSKLQEDLDYYQTKYEDDKEIYFHRNTFTYSYEKRKIDLIVISSHTQKCEERISRIPLLFPEQSEQTPFMFEKEKKCLFFSTRVHPGETPGQHNFNGALQFLLNKNDPVAQIARENFVFYLVPMINPDGVYRGHYRVDALGQNLNRFYLKPLIQEQPQIYAIRELISYLNDTQRIHGYIDFHSQASRKGNFIYANHTDFRNQIDICLFCRVLSLNTPYFEYDQCNFTEKNMYSKDKSDNLSKEGSGRVALFKQFKINLTFTVESSYNQGNIENKMYPRSNMLQKTEQQQNEDMEIYDAQLISNPLELQPYQINEHFTIEQQNKLGEGVVETFLDMCEMNPFSRIKNSPYKSFINAKLKMAFNLMKVPPFRFDLYIRKLMRSFVGNPNPSKAVKQLYNFVEKDIKEEITLGQFTQNKTKAQIQKNKQEFVQKVQRQIIQQKPLQTDLNELSNGMSQSVQQNQIKEKNINKYLLHKTNSENVYIKQKQDKVMQTQNRKYIQDSNNEQLQADKNIGQINQKIKQINEKKKQHKGEVGEKSCNQKHNNLQIGYDITDQTKKNVWNKKLTIPRSQNTSRKKENSTRAQSREQQFKSKDNKSSQDNQLRGRNNPWKTQQNKQGKGTEMNYSLGILALNRKISNSNNNSNNYNQDKEITEQKPPVFIIKKRNTLPQQIQIQQEKAQHKIPKNKCINKNKAIKIRNNDENTNKEAENYYKAAQKQQIQSIDQKISYNLSKSWKKRNKKNKNI